MNIDKYPKSKEKFKEFTKEKLVFFQSKAIENMNVTEMEVDIPEVSDEIVEQFMPLFIQNSPRGLYDFFDQNKVYLTIDWTSSSKFFTRINEEEILNGYTTRIEAEVAGFKAAFETLENKL